MAGQGDATPPSGAIALLASAISYALGACAQVAPAEMCLRTPCADWDLAALLAHLATSMADLESAIRTGHLDLGQDLGQDLDQDGDQDGDQDRPDSPAPGPRPGPVPGDPVEVLRDQAANLLSSCYGHHGPERLVLVGGLPLAAGIVACTGAVEIAVHGWDVSAARGRGDPIPPALAARMLGLCPLLVTGREGLFAAPVEVSSGASPGDRLVGYLGRDPARRNTLPWPSVVTGE
jgi:uncharacterized protein (TIGR03086 family)